MPRGKGQGVGGKKQGDGGADYCVGPNGEKKLWEGSVEIKKGKKTFITERSFN